MLDSFLSVGVIENFPIAVKDFCDNPYRYANGIRLVIEREVFENKDLDHYNIGLVSNGYWTPIGDSAENDFDFYASLKKQDLDYISFHLAMDDRGLSPEVLREIVESVTTEYEKKYFYFAGEGFDWGWEHGDDRITEDHKFSWDYAMEQYSERSRVYADIISAERWIIWTN